MHHHEGADDVGPLARILTLFWVGLPLSLYGDDLGCIELGQIVWNYGCIFRISTVFSR